MERDIEILNFINGMGYCTAWHLGNRFSLKLRRVYKIMGRLIEAGFVHHQRIYHGMPGVFYLSKAGALYTSLPCIDSIPKGIYDHQLMVVDVAIRLFKLHPDAAWVSERHLKQQKFHYGIGKANHIADGLLIFPDKRKIAIEVEMTMKSKSRLNEIFNAYGSQLNIEQAWYFCADEIIDGMTALSEKKDYIKIHSLKELLHESL